MGVKEETNRAKLQGLLFPRRRTLDPPPTNQNRRTRENHV
jgi:hypothetical protein